MADGSINIDFQIPVDQARSDANKISEILGNVGQNIGNDMDSSFEDKTETVEKDAKETQKNVKNTFGDEVEQKITADDDGLKSKVTESKEKIKSIPESATTKLLAQAKTAGIENFESVLKTLPKQKQTELLTKVNDSGTYDFEAILKEIPAKKVTELKLNDQASTGLKSLQDEATKTSDHFSRLKDIIAGSIAGQAITSAFAKAQELFSSLISSSIEYNKTQQTSLSSWTTLTNSASKGQTMVDMANEMSNKFGQAYDVVDELDQQFYHVLDNSDKTKTLTTSFLTLADTIGLSSSQVQTLGQDFTHTLSGGLMQLSDFNQVSDYLPMFGEKMLEYERKIQNNSSLTMTQLRAEMSAGKISATDAETVINQLGQKYKDSADNMLNTLPGLERAISAKAPQLVSELINPFLKAENPIAKAVLNWLKDPNIDSSMKSLGEKFAVVTNGITEIFMTAFGIIGGILSSFSESFKVNMGTLTSSGVGKTIDSIVDSFKKLAKAIEPVESAVGGFFGVIAGGAVRTAVTIIEGLAKGFEGAGSGADKAKSKMNFDGVFKIITGISQALNTWLDAFNKVLKPLGEIVGAIVKGAFETFADIISGIAKAFGELFDNSSKAAKPLGSLGKGLSNIADHQTALKALGSIIATYFVASKFFEIAKSVSNMVKSFSLMASVEKVWATLKGAIETVRIEMLLFNDAVMENPFVAIAVAIVAVGVAFYEAYKHIKPFREAVNAVTKTIVSGLKTAFDWVKNNWVGLALILVNPIAGGLKLLYDNNSGFKKWADSIWDSVKSGLKSFEKGWDSFWGSIGKTLSGWGKTINKTWSSIWSGIEKVSSVIWNSLKKAAELAFKGIVYTALAPLILMVATVVAIWKLIEKPTMAAWNLIKQYIVKPIQEAYKSVVDYLKQLWKDIKNIWDSIKKYTSDVFNTIYEFVKKIWDEISDFIVDTAKSIWKTVVKWFDDLKDDIEDIWNAIKKFTISIWNPIKDFVVGIAESIWKQLVKTFTTLKNSVEDIWNAISSVTSSIWNSISSWVVSKATDIWKGIKGVFNSLKDDISTILGDISSAWQNTWNGISSFFSGIWKDIKSLAKDGINDVIGFLNGGIDGVDDVIHFFGGDKKTISGIPKLANGSGPVSGGTPAIVNDEPAADFREAIIRKNGEVEIPHGRNVLTYLSEGDSVVPATFTKALFGDIPQYASGTGDWISKIWNGVTSLAGDAVDDLSAITDAIAHPLKTIEGIFDKVTDSATGVWSALSSNGGSFVEKSAVNWFKKELNSLKDAFEGDDGSSIPTADHEKLMQQAGIPSSWYNAMNWLVNTESGWKTTATNKSSGAYGLPQALPGSKMASAGSDWKTNPVTQLKWMYDYVQDRYGTANKAVAFHKAKGWYANGGFADEASIFAEDGLEAATPLESNKSSQGYEMLGKTAAYMAARDGLQNSVSQSSNIATDLKEAFSNLGNIEIKSILDGKTISEASYPFDKALQASELTVSATGTAIRVGGG